MEISKKIQQLRIKSGLSQEALAEQLEITRQSVSKWETGQALPDTEKIIQLSRLFGVTTDWLLLNEGSMVAKKPRQSMRFGMYLITKDFAQSVGFYEKLLCLRVSIVGVNRFAQFFFDGVCMSIMNELHLPGHDYSGCGDHKFVLNFWVSDLVTEHERVKSINIGRITEIIQPHASYNFFNVYDPDGNVIEITGDYTPPQRR